MKINFRLTFFLILAIALQLGCIGHADSAKTKSVKETTVIAAVGDIMLHKPMITSAFDNDTKSYYFSPMLEPVQPYLERADLTFGNLETRFAGAERGYTGYPMFNAPDSMATALKAAGFDFLGTANNHTLDTGWNGIKRTLDVLDKNRLFHTGTARSAAEYENPRIIIKNGIKIGVICATEMLNGLTIPSGHPYAVNLLKSDKIIAMARKCRAEGAEIVIAILHWGVEYQRQPNSSQQAIAQKLLTSGVDIILGSHPHVVQPMKWITVNKNGKPFKRLVVYSMGNFCSNQSQPHTDYGITAYFKLERVNGVVNIVDAAYMPVWVRKSVRSGGGRTYTLVPAHSQIIPKLSPALTSSEKNKLQTIVGYMREHIDTETNGIKLVDINAWGLN